jgi:hypothetical protein
MIMAAVLIARYASANPLPECEIQQVRAFPPEIGVYFNTDLDISGYLIHTSTGTAVVDSGVFGSYDEFLILDSTNTSGFAMNAEGDSIVFENPELGYIVDQLWYGNLGYAPVPINGHSIHLAPYNPWQSYVWSFDFSIPAWGETDIVINEIGPHCTWEGGSNFIELYNRSDSSINLNGWRVVCDTICDLPSNATIFSHGFYVIDGIDFPGSFDMDFGADNIYLIDGNDRLVDQVGWSSDHGENISFMRYPDGDVEPDDCSDFMGYDDESSYTFENGFPSRGAPNRHESPGFVVIGTRAVGEESFVDLYWTNPIWDELYNATVAVRSDDHFPETIDDGDIVYQGTDQHVTDYGLLPEHWYYYTVFARNDGGEYSIPTDESRASVYTGSGVGIGETEVPDRIGYLRAYPNPFNATTTIEYGLTESSYFTLSVYNLLGQRIAIIFEGIQDAGEHSITWDASAFPSGVYFARLEAGGRSKTVKIVLLR